MKVLHVGCGRDPLPAWLSNAVETRLDIDPACEPDIIGNMLCLGDIGPFDALYCSHALEHLYPHQVPVALAEFRRVLADGGFATVFVPDLEDAKPTEEVLFESPGGAITGLDLIYGLRSKLAEMPHMAHHTGFTRQTLDAAMKAAGFAAVHTDRIANFNLISAGRK